MSAADLLTNRLRYLAGVEFSGTAAAVACETMASAADELVALRAELAALKARRCDGCAHYEHDAGCHRLVTLVRADFSCAAWTEKP